MRKILYFFAFLFTITACKTKRTSLDPIEVDNSKNLYAFIGKKISVAAFDPNKNYGSKSIDTITGDTIIMDITVRFVPVISVC